MGAGPVYSFAPGNRECRPSVNLPDEVPPQSGEMEPLSKRFTTEAQRHREGKERRNAADPGLGFFLALPVGWIVIGPLCRIQAWRNGAPFEPGDCVRVLVGPYRGRITCVRELWQGDRLRVALGPEADHAFKDIFSPTQLLREANADAPPNSRPPSPFPQSPDVQMPDSQRTPSTDGCG